MNPVLNFLITGGVILFLVAFFAIVAYIVYRVLRHGERYFRDSGLPPAAPPAPPEPPSRPSRGSRGRRRR